MSGRDRLGASFTILALAFVVRLIAAIVWEARVPEGQQFVWGDSDTYWEIAETYVQTGTYAFGDPPQRIFRAPAYPVVLMAGMMTGQFLNIPFTPFAARIVGCCLGTLSVGLLMGLGRELSRDRRVGRLAGFFMALEPGAIAMSVFVLAEAVFVPLMLLQLWAWTLAWRSPNLGTRTQWGLLAGILWGTAVLARPSWLLFVPFVVLATFLLRPKRSRQMAIALVLLLGLLISMGPWWYRNYQWTGRFVPTTLQVGASLYDGWNPWADGSSDMSHGYRVTRPLQQRYRLDSEADLGAIPGVKPRVWALDLDDQGTQSPQENRSTGPRRDAAIELEIASDELLKQEALNWGQANVGRLLQLFVVKVARTWRPWPTASEVNHPGLVVVNAIGFIVVIVLASIGLGAALPRGWEWSLCVWPALYITVLHGVFVGSMRYRQPAMLTLLILAAFSVWAIWDRWQATRDK